MSPAQRRYLFVEQGVGSVVVNALVNAAIAWAIFRRMDVVPLYGDQSIAGDTIATSLLLPFFTSLIVTPLARREARVGRVVPLAIPAALRWLPGRVWLRGLLIGLMAIVVLGIPTVVLLQALGVTGMSFGRFVAFKAAFAATVGLLVTPPIALLGLASAPAPADALRRGSAA